MTRKATSSTQIPSPQRLEAEPVNDAAELAAVDEMRKRYREAAKARAAAWKKPLTAATRDLLEQAEHVPAEDRLRLIAELVARLHPGHQAELMTWLTAELPVEVLAEVEVPFLARLR
jgi:hypothetical protein